MKAFACVYDAFSDVIQLPLISLPAFIIFLYNPPKKQYKSVTVEKMNTLCIVTLNPKKGKSNVPVLKGQCKQETLCSLL